MSSNGAIADPGEEEGEEDGDGEEVGEGDGEEDGEGDVEGAVVGAGVGAGVVDGDGEVAGALVGDVAGPDEDAVSVHFACTATGMSADVGPVPRPIQASTVVASADVVIA